MATEEKVPSIESDNKEIKKESEEQDIVMKAMERYRYVSYISAYPPLSRMDINPDFSRGLVEAVRKLSLGNDKEAKDFYKFLDEWAEEIKQSSDMYRKYDDVDDAVKAYIKMNPGKKYTELDFK